MTDNGDNDTSVADKVGAVRGVPGDGESPMRAVQLIARLLNAQVPGEFRTNTAHKQNDRDGDGSPQPSRHT